jgi:hypothetical protein
MIFLGIFAYDGLDHMMHTFWRDKTGEICNFFFFFAIPSFVRCSIRPFLTMHFFCMNLNLFHYLLYFEKGILFFCFNRSVGTGTPVVKTVLHSKKKWCDCQRVALCETLSAYHAPAAHRRRGARMVSSRLSFLILGSKSVVCRLVAKQS